MVVFEKTGGITLELEVLAPAGDRERLLSALNYGADAVYLGRKNFGMRASSSNFDYEGLMEAVKLSHEKGVKVYLTCNTLPRNSEIPLFEQFVKEAVEKAGSHYFLEEK